MLCICLGLILSEERDGERESTEILNQGKLIDIHLNNNTNSYRQHVDRENEWDDNHDGNDLFNELCCSDVTLKSPPRFLTLKIVFPQNREKGLKYFITVPNYLVAIGCQGCKMCPRKDGTICDS